MPRPRHAWHAHTPNLWDIGITLSQRPVAERESGPRSASRQHRPGTAPGSPRPRGGRTGRSWSARESRAAGRPRRRTSAVQASSRRASSATRSSTTCLAVRPVTARLARVSVRTEQPSSLRVVLDPPAAAGGRPRAARRNRANVRLSALVVSGASSAISRAIRSSRTASWWRSSAAATAPGRVPVAVHRELGELADHRVLVLAGQLPAGRAGRVVDPDAGHLVGGEQVALAR